MTTIVTRAGKGVALTWTEMDANLTNLNTNKLESANPTISGTLTHSGDVLLSGSGKRITGDFSNATVTNRLMFQTSTVNGNTVVQALPNGSGPGAYFGALNNSDAGNFSRILIGVSQTGATIESQAQGSGTYLPMTFYTGGSERMRIDTSGNVGIGTASPFNSAGYGAITTNGTTGSVYSSQVSGVETARLQSSSGAFDVQAIGASTVLQLSANGSERLQIGTSGQIGIAGANYGTSGQALVSNGSDAAPSWQTISAGLTAASTAEAQAGTIDTKAITPLKLREGLNATGTAPVYACRAWVNFNGTGTVAIRARGNVSSITDNGTGDYTVNFTTAMPDSGYCVQVSGSEGSGYQPGQAIGAIATSSVQVLFSRESNSNTLRTDPGTVCVAIFR